MSGTRVIATEHGRHEFANDQAFEIRLTDDLRGKDDRAGLIALCRGVCGGRGAIVDAGAVVTKNVPVSAKVAGVPANLIG